MDEREMFESHFGIPVEQRRSPSAGGYAQREYQMMWAGWQAARRTTPDREAIIEECAKTLEEEARAWGYPVPIDMCAKAIRALKTAPTSDQGEKS
ncbi:hypothetical protein [Burkholderia multivorans]|uniref:hypothetical protein n=1 Tax=Burkholderia multivorans TaxID=87883 RepID=UPI0009E0E110|nr:hypothetical protein [Burkholderia multivorans]SAK33252.1 hypothetical protein UA11_01909 [Burkholderia multivorans]